MKKLSTLMLALVLGCAVQAQSLAELAPADAVLSLGWSSSYDIYDTLDEDFAALPWEEAGEVLAKLVNALIALDADPDLTDFAITLQDTLENRDEDAEPYADVLEFCPNFESIAPDFDALEDYDTSQLTFEALATLGVSSFSPIPAATALLRVEGDEDYSELLVRVREVLLECYSQESGAQVSTLEQDGVTLYVVGDGGDFPFVAGNAGNLFFLGTNPESVRSALRKLNGADEPSLADTELYQQSATRFEASQDTLSISVDFAAVADALQGVSGFIIDGPETEYLVNRGLAALRTLGGYSAQISATPEGLVSESAFAVNREGGDPALADYILCDTCRASAPFLAPEDASSVSAAYIPWRDLWIYAETWLNELSAISGENLNLRTLVQEELGLNLDVALFNWLGSEVHTYVLEPYSPNLSTLIYGQAQATVIPISSPEAAQAGFDEWKRVLADEGLIDINDIENLTGADPEIVQFLGMLAARPYGYKGNTINRVQFSATSDIGYSFVGNYLVVGSPAAAVERIIDTFEGGRSALTSPALRDLRSADATVTTYGYADSSANIQGVANLFELLVQPAAFGTRLALDGLINDASLDTESFNFDDLDIEDAVVEAEADEAYLADIEGISAEPLEFASQASGVIEESDLDNLDYLTDFYELTGLSVGDEVTVSVQSDDFDTYIWLIEAESSDYLAENDDSSTDSSASELSFSVREGERYWVEISSYNGEDLGAYTVSVEAAQADALTPEPVEPVTQAALSLQLGDELEDALETSELNDGVISDLYELGGFAAGERVTVRMESAEVDTYIYLIDAATGQTLDQNDDFDGDIGVSELSFVAQEGVTYQVRFASYDEDETGAYSLSLQSAPEVEAAPAAPELNPEDLPSFAELLDLYDLLPESLKILADHIGNSQSRSLIEGDIVYQRGFTEVEW